MFRAAAGIDIQHVPYKGSAPAVTDLIGGQIQIMFDPLQSVLSNVQGGKMRALAVSSKARSPVVARRADHRRVRLCRFRDARRGGACSRRPDCRTRWRPCSSPRSSASRASDAFRGKLEPLGVTAVASLGGSAFADFQKSEIAKWGKAVQDAGVKID